uniref:Uncharacterized protein n=1 Tax=Trichobilharzia regenti TaxID=157069 RepID=A0AA85JP02_TRIRE|nr:unnamed protein product [Trichobilharzia regenti]
MMQLIDQNQSTLFQKNANKPLNVIRCKLSSVDDQPISEKLNKNWTMKSLLQKSKPKSEWDKYAVVDRSNWFKSQMPKSPSPTHYNIKRIHVERPLTYSFKNTGRMKPSPILTNTNNGLWLLPGAYEVCKVDEKLNQCQRSYSFKSMPRKFNDILFGRQDKDLCLAPGQYNPYNETSRYHSQSPSYHSAFKSKNSRSVTRVKQDQVPPPGAYNLYSRENSAITSPFVSQVPRFRRTKSVSIFSVLCYIVNFKFNAYTLTNEIYTYIESLTLFK